MIGSVSRDQTIGIWNPYTGKNIIRMRLRESSNLALDFSESGQFILTGGLNNFVAVFDIRAQTGPTDLFVHNGYVSCAKFIGDRYVLSGSGDTTIVLTDIEQNVKIQKYTEHVQDITCVSLSSDRNTFITSSCDNTIKIWDLRSGECVHTYFKGANPYDVDCVSFHQSGHMFCYSYRDHTAVIDIRAHATLAKFVLPSADSRVSCMSKSGRLVFSGHTDGTLCVWDMYKEKMIKKLNNHKKSISGIDISPNGNAIVTSSWDCNVTMYY